MANFYGNPLARAPNADQAAQIEAFKKMVTPAGQTYKQYLDAKMAPKDPLQRDIEAMRRSGVGDQDYEAEQLMNYYQSPAGKKQMDAFYKANSEWYNPDGSRTDHMMTPLDLATKEWQANGRVGVNPVSAALREYQATGQKPTAASLAPQQGQPSPQPPAPVVDARPPIVSQQPANSPPPAQSQQAAQAAAIRNYMPQQNQKSSWQAGGWG